MTKHYEGKTPMGLLDLRSLDGLVRVIRYGNGKYGRDSWKHGSTPHSEYAGALLRHLAAWQSGEDFDPDSGEHHLDHVLCNAMILSWLSKHRADTDDRSADGSPGPSVVSPAAVGGPMPIEGAPVIEEGNRRPRRSRRAGGS